MRNMSLDLDTAIFNAEARNLQAELFARVTAENTRLLKDLKGWKRRAEDSETQVSSLRMPEGFAAIEHATLRTELVGAQARQDALQNEVGAEKEKRIAAEDTKKHLLSQHAALTEDNDRLKEELERALERHSEGVLTQTAERERDDLQNTITTLRTELEGKDREVRELTVEVQSLLAQLEKTQNAQAEGRQSILSQLDAVGQGMAHETLLQERNALSEQLAAAQKENEDLKIKVAQFEAAIQSGAATINPSALKRAGSQVEAPASRAASSKPGAGKRKRGGKKEGPVDFVNYASPIPPARMEVLAGYPEIDPSLPPELAGPVSFTKTELSQLLGGSTQGLFVRVTKSARPLAVKYDIGEYLCPNLNQNSWLPTKPGAHGYMQVGLGDRDRVRFEDAEIRPVFVGAESQFRYFGTYELKRVERLTVEEWLTLPEKSQYEYSETTKDKEKEHKNRNVEDILQDYRSGTLRAPCVLLKCIGFNVEFYREFLEAARKYSAAFGTVTMSTTAASSSQAPSASPTPAPEIAKRGTKRAAGNRFHVDGTETDADEVQEGGSPPKRRRTSMGPPQTPVRRSGRLSIKLPGSKSGRAEDAEDEDGVSSDSSAEYNGEDGDD